MSQRVLYDVPFLTISYDYTHDWLYADWHGQLDDEVVVTGALKLLELLKLERCSKVLNDNTHIKGIWADAAQWGAQEFLPQLYEAGCRFFAWVYSADTYSKLSAELAVERTNSGIVIMTFQDVETAAGWLGQM